jgi:hypothetical protein
MLDLKQINVLAELERLKIKYEWASDTEVKILCPFHADSSPSCFVNTQEHIFACNVAGCTANGNILKLLARILNVTQADLLLELTQRYTLDISKVVNPEVVERYHEQIWKARPLLIELYKRGITDAIIRRRRFGEHNGRITIPRENFNGLWTNIRKYLPGAPGPQKMKNLPGRGKAELYPVDQLKFPKLMLCGGECKALVAAEQLNQHGIGCVTVTAGEGIWLEEFNSSFVGKPCYVCMDIDEAGVIAAEQHCARLYRIAESVSNVVLPLDKDKYPKGDINDFCATENGLLLPLIDAAIPYAPKIRQFVDENETPEELTLCAAMHADKTAKRVRVKATVSVVDISSYTIPKRIIVKCSRKETYCPLCTVFGGVDEHRILRESAPLIEMVGAHKSVQQEAIKSAIGIPKSCEVCELVPIEFYNIEDTRISPQIEITNRATDRVMQSAYVISEQHKSIELNASYHFTGRMYPHPKTQQSVLLISQCEPAQDSLSTYECTDLGKLQLFRPKEFTVEATHDKLQDLYLDLETNVTRIWQRRDLHLLVDLAYHSPMVIDFDRPNTKGCVEVLIMGDTAQGKSAVTCGTDGNGGLMHHYSLGVKVDAKNASVAGLLGGCQQMGGRWLSTWGAIPSNDKRLVIIEELKGMKPEVLAALTDMRSSQVASISKIDRRQTQARVRLIMNSNTESGRMLSAYNFGIESIRELIRGLEDIRRFDAAYLCSKDDVDNDVINRFDVDRPSVEHLHTSELCRSLILWAWTRTQEQVIFSDECKRAIRYHASRLCKIFSDEVPLIDRGTTAIKIARLAASLAARQFSASDDNGSIIVRVCHAEYIAALLERIYSADSFGYLGMSKALQVTQTITETDKESLVKFINETPFPKDYIEHLLHTSRIERVDIQDWCACGMVESGNMLSLLVRKHAMQREGRAYRKTPEFIELLKMMLEKNLFIVRPDFVQERRF